MVKVANVAMILYNYMYIAIACRVVGTTARGVAAVV